MPLDETERRQIEKFEDKLRPVLERMLPLEAEANKWRTAINAVLEAAGEEPRYTVGQQAQAIQPEGASRLRPYGRGDFYDKPLASVVAQIITERGPLNEHELYELMVTGGFAFKESDPEKATSNLKISLGKNTRFGKTTAGHYVLAPSGRRTPRAAGVRADGEGEQVNGDGTNPSSGVAESSAIEEPEVAG